MIDLKDLAAKPQTMRMFMNASRIVPVGLGNRLAWIAARIVCQLKPQVYQVARSNLSAVLGPGVDPRTLDRAVHRVFYTTIKGHIELYRALQLPHDELAALVDVPEVTQQAIDSMWKREDGTVLVMPHLGNFDLGGQVLAGLLPEMQVLSLPNPPAGFQLANEIRSRTGVNVTPLTPAALREAIKLLRRGGVVSVAGDRPVSELDEPVSFFGRPARVPSGHVRLALKTGASIVMGYFAYLPETKRYIAHFDSPLEMIRTGNRHQDVELNMRRVLDALEGFIRNWPDQWQMYVPVWPELLEA
jgi:KDO2-lipid IV(A) lauroyltransferase